jgi:hypothetical protein
MLNREISKPGIRHNLVMPPAVCEASSVGAIRQGPELLDDDELRSGRLPIGFLDIQILSSLEEQPFYSTYSLAEMLDVPHTTF